MKENAYTLVTRVRWSDTDKNAHVNNSKYFEYFEEARSSWVYEKTNLIKWCKENNIQLVIAEQSCKYLLPLTHPNNIEVTQYISKVGIASIEFEYELRLAGEDKIYTTARVKLAAYNTETKKPQKISKNFKENLLKI